MKNVNKTESKGYKDFKANYDSWKASGMTESFGLYGMKANLKRKDMARQAARNEKKQRLIMGEAYE